jgi:hypothetical protein
MTSQGLDNDKMNFDVIHEGGTQVAGQQKFISQRIRKEGE